MCTEGGKGGGRGIFYPYSKRIRFLASPKLARVREVPVQYLAAAALQ